MTRKELRPVLEDTSCDICGRTILKGERTENYLAPGGQRYIVCELCTDRAYQEGWIRESAHDELPASYPREQRRSILGRFRRRRGREAEQFEPLPENGELPVEAAYEDPAATAGTAAAVPLEEQSLDQPAEALAPGEEPAQPPPPPAEPAGTPV